MATGRGFACRMPIPTAPQRRSMTLTATKILKVTRWSVDGGGSMLCSAENSVVASRACLRVNPRECTRTRHEEYAAARGAAQGAVRYLHVRDRPPPPANAPMHTLEYAYVTQRSPSVPVRVGSGGTKGLFRIGPLCSDPRKPTSSVWAAPPNKPVAPAAPAE
jgi:hypothetical protein